MDRQTSPLVVPRLREMGSSRSRPVASHPSLVEKTDTVPLAPGKLCPEDKCAVDICSVRNGSCEGTGRGD